MRFASAASRRASLFSANSDLTNGGACAHLSHSRLLNSASLQSTCTSVSRTRVDDEHDDDDVTIPVQCSATDAAPEPLPTEVQHKKGEASQSEITSQEQTSCRSSLLSRDSARSSALRVHYADEERAVTPL